MPAQSDRQARRIEGSGTPDQVWLSWPGLNDLPGIGAHALVPPGTRAAIVGGDALQRLLHAWEAYFP